MQVTTSFHRENYVNYRGEEVFWLFIAHSVLCRNSQLLRGQLLKRSVTAVKWPLHFSTYNSQGCQPRIFVIDS